MIELNRRSLLGGLAAAIAAPYVVRSGILMPVKSILQPNVVTWFEGSYDGKQWFPISRINGRAAGSNPVILAELKEGYAARKSTFYNYTRTVIDREWTPQKNIIEDFAKKANRRYPSLAA